MMRPLLERLPVLGAVQVAFVDLPTFDMDVTCYGGEMWMLGPIKTFFINMIRDVVLGQYVFPDTLTIPIDQVSCGCGGVLIVVAVYVQLLLVFSTWIVVPPLFFF